MHSFVFFNLGPIFVCSKIEGSKATAKQTVELLRSFISQQRLPQSHQAAALIEAVRTVGEKLIAANPVGMLTRYPHVFYWSG